MAVTVDGELPDGVTAKDLILAVIAQIGTGGGQGYVIEYRGEAIRALSMEGRMTVCNMSIEAGARAGMIAPDETTFDYLQGRPHAPNGADWDDAVDVLDDPAHRRRRRVRRRGGHRRADADAVRHLGHQPRPGPAAVGAVPDPAELRRRGRPRRRRSARWSTWASTPGTPLRDIAVDTVFVGSCTNGRIEDLRAAAEVLRGRKVADGVRMLVVPGSVRVRLQAEDEGLDEVFTDGRRRVARRRLLDVPGHEPRPARAGRAQRVDVQPQLRGPAGQGRAHPPGVAAGRRGHRRDRAR